MAESRRKALVGLIDADATSFRHFEVILKTGTLANRQGVNAEDRPASKDRQSADRIAHCRSAARLPDTPTAHPSLMGLNPSDFEGDSFPVEKVSWKDAQEFIDKLNAGNEGFKYRLPTDAEWEYACRAGTTGLYYGNLDEIGWHKRNSGNHPHAVGGKQPNAFGLYDMSGNVSEWVQDWYSQRDRYRGLRGGSWDDLTIKLRSGNESGMHYYSRRNYIGFRVAVERAK